jgi:hypothetical protein
MSGVHGWLYLDGVICALNVWKLDGQFGLRKYKRYILVDEEYNVWALRFGDAISQEFTRSAVSVQARWILHKSTSKED